jgi:hypothetical protein
MTAAIQAPESSDVLPGRVEAVDHAVTASQGSPEPVSWAA